MTLLDDEEVPIVEFETLRRLAQYEAPDRGTKRAVFTAIREQLAHVDEAPRRRWSIGRIKWLTPGLVLLSLPTAMAATDVGRHLVEQLREVLPMTLIGRPKEELRPANGPAKSPTARGSRQRGTTVENSLAVAPTALPTADPPVTAGSEPAVTSPPPRAPAPVVAPAAAAVASRDLEQEAAIIRAARYALSQRDYAFAIVLAERHARFFPAGALAHERDTIQRRAIEEASVE